MKFHSMVYQIWTAFDINNRVMLRHQCLKQYSNSYICSIRSNKLVSLLQNMITRFFDQQ